MRGLRDGEEGKTSDRFCSVSWSVIACNLTTCGEAQWTSLDTPDKPFNYSANIICKPANKTCNLQTRHCVHRADETSGAMPCAAKVTNKK